MQAHGTNSLDGRHIVLIVTGSVAASKSPQIADLLEKGGAKLSVILTPASRHFIAPEAFGTAAVYESLFSENTQEAYAHIELTRKADLVLVAPATADILAKMAMGLADDLASSTLLASRCPVWVCPAMNTSMWEHEATRRNIEILRARGIGVVDPQVGPLACGDYGIGRLEAPAVIFEAVCAYLTAPLKGRRIIVTAGGTEEALDPVRYIGNRSSGKQAVALAEVFRQCGAEVVFISAPMAIPRPFGLSGASVISARQMYDAVMAEIAANPVDAFFSVAAVADFRPHHPSSHKMKKAAAPLEISLEENPDILKAVAALLSGRPKLVAGFALETENLLKQAYEKMKDKKCDWILANEQTEGQQLFGADETHIFRLVARMKSPQEAEDWGTLSKKEVAYRVAAKTAAYF